MLLRNLPGARKSVKVSAISTCDPLVMQIYFYCYPDDSINARSDRIGNFCSVVVLFLELFFKQINRSALITVISPPADCKLSSPLFIIRAFFQRRRVHQDTHKRNHTVYKHVIKI